MDMAQETGVQRLDYSKPPPGYDGLESPRGYEYLVASSWAHYKLEHDPPGMVAESTATIHPTDGRRVTTTGIHVETHGREAEARAAAWARHDRRHALSLRDGGVLLWSVYLAMTDEEVAFAEAHSPEVAAGDPEEALRNAQTEAREAEACVHALRRDLELAEQRAQQRRARVRELSEVFDTSSCEVSWLADPNCVSLRFEGLPFDIRLPDAAAKAMAKHVLLKEMTALQDEVERLGRVKAAAPETLHLALSEADGQIERLRKVLADVRDDLTTDGPSAVMDLARGIEQALARLEVLG